MNRRPRFAIGLVTAAVLCGTSLWVYAQTGPGTGNALIPYQGRVENDGVPVEGPTDFRVALFPSAGANTDCLTAGVLGACGVWADEMADVPVTAGRFAFELGAGNALAESVIQQNDSLHLGVAVYDDTDGWVVLGGVQRLGSVPFAVRADASADLIADSLTVSGSASTGGALDVGGGLLVVGATTLDGTATTRATRHEGSGDSYYQHTLARYLVVADYTASAPVRSYTAIPNNVMQSYCGDEDGCRITLRMKNWTAADLAQNATSMSFHFNYGTPYDGGTKAPWRREELATGTSANNNVNEFAVAGIDGATVANATHVARNHDCYFTPRVYQIGGANSDTGLGMGLLNYDTSASAYTPECQLIIDD